ncbi:MAG: hypothetical protein ACE366_26305 [Bradymonadia bacterium]
MLLTCVTGCDDETRAPTGPETPCGQGALTLTLGAEHPWRALTSAEAESFPVEAGNQGGFHIEPSFRLHGAFDPDEATVSLRLVGPNGTLGQYYETQVLLWLSDGACDYDLARVVLVDQMGGLLSQEAVTALEGVTLELQVEISSALGVVEETLPLQVALP